MLTKLTVMIISQCIQILKSLCCIPETNMLYINYTSKEKKKMGKKNPPQVGIQATPRKGDPLQHKPSKDGTDGSSQWPVMNVHPSLPHGLRQRLV